MKRNEYMDQLKKELSFLTEENRQAALAFYDEMLDDRMEDGMDEESAVRAMEAPADIAARLRAEGVEEIIAASPLRLGIRDEALEFATLSGDALRGIDEAMRKTDAAPQTPAAQEAAPAVEQAPADREAEEKEDRRPAAEPEATEQPREAPGPQAARAKAPWEEAVDSAFEAVGQALEATGKTVENLFSQRGETQKNSGNGEFQRMEWTGGAEGIDGIRLLLSNMPIVIEPAEDDRVTLIYYASAHLPYRVKLDGGVLTLSCEEKEKPRPFSFSFFTNGLKWVWGLPSPTVELRMPRQMLADLTAQTSNCSIRLHGLHALCDTVLKTSNSRISVEKITCKSLDAHTSNSRLMLEEVASKQFLRGKTGNARIEARKIMAGGDLSLTTSNGRISLEKAATPAALAAVTSNANIEVRALRAAGVTLRTSNAAIRGELPGRCADWRIESGTSNGKNSLPRQQAGEKPLSVRTSNASIDLRFEDD